MATITLSSKRKRPASSVLDWMAHRVELERLYLKEDKGLPTVMKFMQSEHNFEASKAQYEAQFKHWGFRKNWSKEHWRYAYFKSKDRQNAGKESVIYLNRTLISQEKANKEIRRHVTVTEQCILTRSLPECPEGLFVCTPPIVALQNLRIDNLPWIRFRSIFESDFSSGFDIAHVARQFSIINQEPPDPSEPSFGLGVFEDSSEEFYGITPRSPAQDPNQSCALYNNKLSALSHEPLALLTSALEKLPLRMQKSSENRQAPWAVELELYHPDPVIYLLKTFLYFLSNSQICISANPRGYNFFDWTAENLPASMLEALLSTEIPTAQACVEQILDHSLRRGNSDLVRTVVGRAGNLLRALQPSKKFDNMFAEAIRLDNIQIVRHFLDFTYDTSQVAPLWNAQSAEMVDFLVDAGANANTVYVGLSNGFIPRCSVTALCWAAYYGRTQVVEALIQKGANVNVTGVANFDSLKFKNAKYGVTPLRVAVDRAVKELEHWDDDEDLNGDDFKLIRLLLEAGAHIDAPSTAINDVAGRAATPLQVASTAGHKSLSRLLLNSGANVNAPACPKGNTALMASVNAGHVSLVEMLLARGAKVDDHGRYESEAHITCLIMAIEREDTNIVKLLLSAGADPNSPTVNRKGFTAIEMAEACDTVEILDILVRFGAQREKDDQIQRQFIRGMSTKDSNCAQVLLPNDWISMGPPGYRSMLLKTAINSGDKNILHSLIMAGVDVNAMIDVDQSDLALVRALPGWDRFTSYITPLGYALSHELHTNTKLSLVSSMLDFGADPNANVSSHIWGLLSPLHFLVNLWISGQAHEDLGQMGFYPHLIRLLLAKGACTCGIGARIFDNIEKTLLQLIASDRTVEQWPMGLEITEILLNAGADVHAAGGSYWDNERYNPLQEAAFRGNLPLVKLLIDHKAEVNAAALDYGSTALQAAVEGGTLRSFEANSMATINFLLDIGADINAPPASTHTGQPALHAAVEGENLALIRRLIDRGADVNAFGNQYGTPIRIAAGSGNLEIANLLVESGANVNRDGPETEEGFTTALENAAVEGRLDMVQLLINAGADTHLPGSKRYRRAEVSARKKGFIAVANFLKNHFEDGTWDL